VVGRRQLVGVAHAPQHADRRQTMRPAGVDVVVAVADHHADVESRQRTPQRLGLHLVLHREGGALDEGEHVPESQVVHERAGDGSRLGRHDACAA
jgi:hypothetical protein